MKDIKAAIRSFVEQNFLGATDMCVRDGDSLLKMHVVDSTGFLEIVGYIEESFGVKVDDDEMIPENLETIESIAQFVARKRAA